MRESRKNTVRRPKTATKTILALSILLFASLSTYAVQYIIPDNSALRQSLSDYLQLPVSEIRSSDAEVFSLLGGSEISPQSVSFEIERQNDRLYLLFLNEKNGAYPIVQSGNVIIRRNLSGGGIEQVKFYIDNIGALVLRVVPNGSRSQLSLALFGDIIYQSIPLSPSIERIMQMSIEDIIKMTSGQIHWGLLLPSADVYKHQNIINIVTEMRKVLHQLPDAEDGAMDAQGRLVRIETRGLADLPGFNCSGFAKFVADGIYSAITGSLMEIDVLKTKHLHLRGSIESADYEESRDPYFGLDWTRNIAQAIASAQSPAYSTARSAGTFAHPEAMDIRSTPFYAYQEDMGYKTSEIPQVLYLESIRNPGRIYLGSVNGPFTLHEPTLWQHYHVVVFFPYFDSAGQFHISVMERNIETSIESIQRRYPQEYIHLVAIFPENEFTLPALF